MPKRSLCHDIGCGPRSIIFLGDGLERIAIFAGSRIRMNTYLKGGRGVFENRKWAFFETEKRKTDIQKTENRIWISRWKPKNHTLKQWKTKNESLKNRKPNLEIKGENKIITVYQSLQNIFLPTWSGDNLISISFIFDVFSTEVF